MGKPTPKGPADYQAVARKELAELDAPQFVRDRIAEDLLDWAHAQERARWSTVRRGKKDPGGVGERRFRRRCRVVVAREVGREWWGGMYGRSYRQLARSIIWRWHDRVATDEPRETWAEINALVAECEAEERPVSARAFSNELRRRIRRLERVCGYRREVHDLPVGELATPSEGLVTERLKNAHEILALVEQLVGEEVYSAALGGCPEALAAIKTRMGLED